MVVVRLRVRLTRTSCKGDLDPGLTGGYNNTNASIYGLTIPSADPNHCDHTYSGVDAHTDPSADTHAHANTDGDAQAHTDSDSYAHPYADACPYGHAYSYSYACTHLPTRHLLHGPSLRP